MRAELASLANSVGANVREARAAAGLTQQKVANGCELDVTYISAIESGRSLPSLKTLIKIAGVTGVATELLVKGLPSWRPASYRAGTCKVPGAFTQEEDR